MRNPSAFLTTALLASLAGSLYAQRVDLTGYWRDDAGGSYQIRQVGNNVYWINDGRPNYMNILFGTFDGSTMRGSWCDLPDSRSQGNGNLVLRVESNDRMVKIASTGSNYSGAVLTRVTGGAWTSGGGGAPGGGGTPGGGIGTGFAAPDSAAIVGTWNWFTGPQVLISPDGSFRQDTSMGLTGRWQLTDPARRTFTLVWSHGYTDKLTLTSDGIRLVAGERLFGTRVSSLPPTPPSNRPVTGTWSWFTGGPVAVFPNGTFRQLQGNLTGTWRLSDPAQRLYTFVWSHGYTDQLILSNDGMQLANSHHVFGNRISDSFDGSSGSSAGFGNDVCSNPSTLIAMDEWLSRAIPPQAPGAGLRYEAWGRMVGSGVTGTITAVSPPDTNLDRCHWLWRYAAGMRSTNNMGTLQEYVRRRLGM